MTKGRKKTIFIFSAIVIIILLYCYRYSTKRLEFLGYYDKVYAHRVNSLEKLEETLAHFNGLELDLVYDIDTNTFDVNHPPTESINLNFETYLKSINTKELPFLWLDIKNLKTDNSYRILSQLNVLFKAHNYPKSKILIETHYPVSLRPFNISGYKTSYYLKPKLHLMDTTELALEIKHIKSMMLSQPYLAISSSYVDYEIMHHYFPKRDKYIWAITSPYNFKQLKIRKVLKDSTVLIVLSSFVANKGNR